MAVINSIPKFLDHSGDVKILQQKLFDDGFNPGSIDGIFGVNTKKALINFQHSKDLIADGIIGKNTLNALGFVLQNQTRNDGYTKLSWEYKVLEAKDWSLFVFERIEELFAKFSQCEDITWFRPDYHALSRKQQVNVWGELISAICFYESGWKPWSYMVESTMGKDPITGKQVKSEGLMQLSYQDEKSYSNLKCRFDWEKDKNKADNDKTRTILDSFMNLEFGIQILANQIEKRKNIALEKGVYWAVLKLNGKYSKLNEIRKMVKLISL